MRTVEAALPAYSRREVRAGPSTLVLQGNAVLIDDEPPVRLPPLLAAVLRALAEQPGRVLSRAELLRRVRVTGRADEHAVEAAVARLRGALDGQARLVRTVPKRGYSLAAATRGAGPRRRRPCRPSRTGPATGRASPPTGRCSTWYVPGGPA
ncbi:winged helix-turn-helix domain-containing protein [Streptomyces sp. NPDC059616]|uniref:winged helix-turn-helix domain-containing protein n=1 Tax=Streptomyces sp. NPDC059616 TaxID=3346886 RepID=UPI00369AA83A